MNYATILSEIYAETLLLPNNGKVAATIPELQLIDPSKFGMHLITVGKQEYGIGDHLEKFSIQSISKVFSLAYAFTFLDEAIWERVGIEPSGSAFNSLVQLEYEKGKPRNPFINAGALVIADILISHSTDPKTDFLAFVRKLTNCKEIGFNEQVAASEKETGFRNTALANFLKSFGNITNDVDAVLDLYFHQCAIEMSCQELAQAFLTFANGGISASGEVILQENQVKRLHAVMQTCGFYDEAGEFTYRVGLPGKSGIGGGIVAVHPHRYAVATWSPRLNEKGNSVQGMQALEALTTKTGMSIF